MPKDVQLACRIRGKHCGSVFLRVCPQRVVFSYSGTVAHSGVFVKVVSESEHPQVLNK